jgi:hypothetical protein
MPTKLEPKTRDFLENQCANVRIILKCILKKKYIKMLTLFIWLRLGRAVSKGVWGPGNAVCGPVFMICKGKIP